MSQDAEGRPEDAPRRTTQEERDRAMAVSSLDDQVRLAAGGDETNLVQGAAGDVHRPPADETGAGSRDDGDDPR
jgi:hypothetical protein